MILKQRQLFVIVTKNQGLYRFCFSNWIFLDIFSHKILIFFSPVMKFLLTYMYSCNQFVIEIICMQKTSIKNERRIFNMKNVDALQEGHLCYGTGIYFEELLHHVDW